MIGRLGPLFGGLFAAGLVTLSLTVAVVLGMQDQQMIAAAEPRVTRIAPAPVSPTPVATSVPTLSPTPEPPTLAPTEIAIELATLSPEPSMSPTPSRALPTPYPTRQPLSVAPRVTCYKRTSWPVFRIQHGDTLSSIARRTGSSVDELKRANCLTGNTIYAGGMLYVPRLPAVPTVPLLAAPKIASFWLQPSGRLTVGECAIIRWSVTGRITKLTLKANSASLWTGTTAAGYWKHCPSGAGVVVYGLTASGPGGTTQASRSLTVVELTETNTPVPGPTDGTATSEVPTAVPTTATTVSPAPATATPTDTSGPPADTPVPPTSTPIPSTATSVPPPATNTPLPPPPTNTPLPPPTNTPVPPPPTKTPSPPPPTNTPVPPPTNTPVPPTAEPEG